MVKKQPQWDKLMRLQRRIDRLQQHHQDAVIELGMIQDGVAEMIIDERERMRREKRDDTE